MALHVALLLPVALSLSDALAISRLSAVTDDLQAYWTTAGQPPTTQPRLSLPCWVLSLASPLWPPLAPCYTDEACAVHTNDCPRNPSPNPTFSAMVLAAGKCICGC